MSKFVKSFAFPLILSIVIFGFMVTCVYATPMIRVELPVPQSVDVLTHANLDIAYRTHDHAMIVGWPEDMERLESCGFEWSVDIENVEEYYRSRLDNSLDEMGGYPTYDEVWAWAQQITADHPDIVSGPDTLGYTLENRPIWVIKISDNPGVDEDEPEVYINSAIHAREVITPMITMNFADMLTDNYGSDARIDEIVNEREVWITPVINVDGYLYNEERDPDGGGMWRKNKRVVDGTVRGVDLNRNFPSMWGQDDFGSSSDPLSQTYRGESAGSEPETQVIMDFINSRHFTMVMNYHSYTSICYIPTNENWQPPDDAETLISLGTYIFETLNWGVGWGGVSGGAIEWQENGADYHTLGFLPEVGTQEDGFWPSLDRQPILVAEHEEPLLRFCEVANHPHQLLQPLAPVLNATPDTVATSFELTWEDQEDPRNNTPVAYDVIELQDMVTTHGFETEDYFPFIVAGFSVTTTETYSGDHSLFSGNAPNTTYGVATYGEYTFSARDTLVMMMKYDIPNADAAVVQASNDYITAALEGNITTPWEQGGTINGHLIFGSSDGEWVEARFPLTSFGGQSPNIIIRYYCNEGGPGAGIYIDDFSPISSFSSVEIVGDDLAEMSYSVSKPDLTNPTLFNYRVRAIDAEGDVSIWSNMLSPVLDPNVSGVAPVITTPMAFNVSPVYPNPFNPTATLNVTLPNISDITVVVYDILGRQVSWNNLGLHVAGTHMINLDGSKWASGVYFVEVEAKAANGEVFKEIRKASLMK